MSHVQGPGAGPDFRERVASWFAGFRAHSHIPHSIVYRIVIFLLVPLVAILTGVVVLLVFRTDAENTSVTQVKQAVGKYQGALSSANSRLTNAGIPAVPTPTSTFTPGPGPSGPSGSSGEPGQQGLPGLPGESGAVGATGAAGGVGPQGQAGPVGPQGQPGVKGDDGDTGPQGPAGADGQPPVSWTYVDALGITHTCSRTADFDPANPTYECN